MRILKKNNKKKKKSNSQDLASQVDIGNCIEKFDSLLRLLWIFPACLKSLFLCI